MVKQYVPDELWMIIDPLRCCPYTVIIPALYRGSFGSPVFLLADF